MTSISPDIYGHHSSEPMMMGSPASPQSPVHHQSAYLPSYLLGDSMSHAVSPVSSRMWSGSGGGGSPPRSSSHKASFLNSPNTSLHHTVGTPRMDSGLRGKDKIGAPPIKSLLQSTSPNQSVYGTPYAQHSQYSSRRAGISSPAPPTSGLSQSMHESVYYSPEQPSFTTSRIPTSPAQLDPFYTQGEALTTEDVLDGTWVTVFGFPPAAASFILQQFSQYGNIVKHVISSEGNWMHIHYQSKIQAKKALSKNGKVIGNSIMVGVSPCIDKKVMDSGKENDQIHCSTPIYGTPDASNTLSSSTSRAPRGTPIRPLTAAYLAAKSDHEVIQNSQAPKKNSGFVNKAMEYVFGW